MDPNALKADCCNARFMLNDILDGCKGNFDYETQKLRSEFKGKDFVTERFIPHCVTKFLTQRKVTKQFTAVEDMQLAFTMDAMTMAKQVFQAVMDGFDKAKSEFEVYSAALVSKIGAYITNKKLAALFQKTKTELAYYAETKKFRKFDKDSMLPSLVITVRDLAEAMRTASQSAVGVADDLREAHCGIHYCIVVKPSLNNDWRSF